MNANDLISKFEEETGQRVDSNDGSNMAMAGLLGFLSREMGKTKHDEKDDVVAGVIIQTQLSGEWQQKEEEKKKSAEMFLALLMMGLE